MWRGEVVQIRVGEDCILFVDQARERSAILRRSQRGVFSFRSSGQRFAFLEHTCSAWRKLDSPEPKPLHVHWGQAVPVTGGCHDWPLLKTVDPEVLSKGYCRIDARRYLLKIASELKRWAALKIVQIACGIPSSKVLLVLPSNAHFLVSRHREFLEPHAIYTPPYRIHRVPTDRNWGILPRTE